MSGRRRRAVSRLSKLRERMGGQLTHWDWWHAALFGVSACIGGLIGTLWHRLL